VHNVRVNLFVTCFNDTLFPQTGRATVRLLERLSCEVHFPLEQTYCGQMHMNSGYPREGVALAPALRAGLRRRGPGRHSLGLVRRDAAPSSWRRAKARPCSS
jgi:Fe-S oxidoreductase